MPFRSFDQMYAELAEKGVEAFEYCLDPGDLIWKRIELLWMLEYFEKEEEYEKCSVVKSAINIDFIAPQHLQEEFNKKHNALKS